MLADSSRQLPMGESTMHTGTRRRFLRDAAQIVPAIVALGQSKSIAASASERMRIGLIGCGKQGGNHITVLSGLKDAQLVSIADIDGTRLGTAVRGCTGAKGVAELRRILDDSSVDAV